MVLKIPINYRSIENPISFYHTLEYTNLIIQIVYYTHTNTKLR